MLNLSFHSANEYYDHIDDWYADTWRRGYVIFISLHSLRAKCIIRVWPIHKAYTNSRRWEGLIAIWMVHTCSSKIRIWNTKWLSFGTEAFLETTQHQQMRICFASSVSSRFHIIIDSGCLWCDLALEWGHGFMRCSLRKEQWRMIEWME